MEEKTPEKVEPTMVHEDLRAVPANGPYYQFGGFWRRLVAALIDGFIIMIFMIPVIIAYFAYLFTSFSKMDFNESSTDYSSHFGAIYGILMLLFLAIPFIYYWILMVKFNTTIGKKLLGMKIVKKDGSKITFGTVFLRQVIGAWVASFIFNLGYLWVGYDIKKRSWADMIAATYVVHYKELSKEEYTAQVNRDQHKNRFIVIALLYTFSPIIFFFIIGFFAAALLIAINPVERFNEAKAENCKMQCSEDQTCLDECLAEIKSTSGSDSSYSFNDGWVNFKSQAETYAIDFPVKPVTQVNDESLGQGQPTLKVTTHVAEMSDGSGYLASSVTYPDAIDTSNPEIILEAVVKGSSGGTGSKLLSSKIGTFQGLPAIDYNVQIPEGYIRAKSFIIENNLYTLSAVSTTNAFPDFDRFTSSFLFNAE